MSLLINVRDTQHRHWGRLERMIQGIDFVAIPGQIQKFKYDEANPVPFKYTIIGGIEHTRMTLGVEQMRVRGTIMLLSNTPLDWKQFEQGRIYLDNGMWGIITSVNESRDSYFNQTDLLGMATAMSYNIRVE